jgi:NifB/MoaA-like Fe-S oxidoreductase
MVALCSDYWGQSITVTGLLTGQDLLQGLRGKYLGDAILIPDIMLKSGELRFLDDMTVEELAKEIDTPILPIRGVEGLIDTCIN